MSQFTNQAPVAGRVGRRAGGLLLVLALLAGGGAACGKKGAPLAPLLRLPGPVETFTARRQGDTVLLQFTIPAKNQDNSTPADLAAVEVYGFTGTPPPNDELIKVATLVATVRVRQPPPPEDKNKAKKTPASGATATFPGAPARPAPAAARPVPAAVEPGFDQGVVVTVSETLTPALLQPVVVKPKRAPAVPKVAPTPSLFLPTALLEEVPTRTYVAVGLNHKGRRGIFSPGLTVPVVPAPLPPGAPTFTYNETTLTISWPPPDDAPAPPVVPTAVPAAVPPAAPPAGPPATPPAAPTPAVSAEEVLVLPPSRSLAPLVSIVPAYNLYLVPKADTTAKPAGPAMPAAGAGPVNATPLAALTFTMPAEMNVERCFALRALRTLGQTTLASPLSPVGCVTARDTFPPLAPKGLSAVASPGEVSLAWEPNAESDLAGYLVLRGEASGGPLQPLTKEPIPETNYVDKTVKPGGRYVYAVAAVDKAGNLSAASNRIEQAAR